MELRYINDLELHDKNKIVYLKVKLKSLAEEARIIKKEESKNTIWRNELRKHRIQVVKREARLTLFLYGFLRGRKYSDLENIKSINSLNNVDAFISIGKMLSRYGNNSTEQRELFYKWCVEAGLNTQIKNSILNRII